MGSKETIEGKRQMESLHLVECTERDVDILKQVSIETFTDTFKNQNEEENLMDYINSSYTTEKLREEITEDESHFYLIEKSEEIIGYLKLNVGNAQTESMKENAMEVERIYIRSKFQRSGYGKYLIQLAESIGKKWNKSYIWLGVWEKNFNARSFYEHMGFHKVGQHSFYMGKEAQVDDILLKRI